MSWNQGIDHRTHLVIHFMRLLRGFEQRRHHRVERALTMLAYNFIPTSLISRSLRRRLDDRSIMQITRIEEVTANSAPLPHEVCGLRLQGHDATSTEGEVTISTDDDEPLLGQMDSCVITADELRAVVSNTNRGATMPANGRTRP
jgi:hypothetical protein